MTDSQGITDVFDDGEQPRCQKCNVLMRDVPLGWQCPACGHELLPTAPIGLMPRFDGPSVRGG